MRAASTSAPRISTRRCPRTAAPNRSASSRPSPQTCTRWRPGSRSTGLPRWPWNRPGSTGSRSFRCWRPPGSRFTWSTPTTPRTSRAARPTSATASGCNTCTRWGCCAAPSAPPDEICAARTLLRHRTTLVAQAATHIQHMQKALVQMNVRLQHVLSDLSGTSGLAIVDALLAGERDPARLAKLRDPRVKASEETVAKALVGDWRAEHLFTLRQAREAYRYCQTQIREYDAEIEQRLAQLRSQVDPTQTPPPPPPPRPPRQHKGDIHLEG